MQSAGGLRLSTVAEEAGPVVEVEGEIDLTTADQLAGQIANAAASHPGDVAVDLGGVSFMDSTGIFVLVMAVRALEPFGRRLTVRNARPAARRTLEITGMAKILGLVPPPADED
jgi:anti-anti-sigma factor